jgi:hypothetical protein
MASRCLAHGLGKLKATDSAARRLRIGLGCNSIVTVATAYE